MNMKHSKLLLASALAAAAWSTAPQAQTIMYGVDTSYGAMGTGSTPGLENTSPYPNHPANIGYAVSEYWENGVLWQRTDPVVVDTRGNVTYLYPETARMVSPPAAVVYTRPETGSYGVPVYEIRTQ